MSAIFHIARKEFREYFSSVIGYVFLTLVLFITGLFYWIILKQYAEASAQVASNPMMAQDFPSVSSWVMGGLFQNFAVILLFTSPLLTMRLIAEEKKNHTLEFLMTSPVSSGEIILGKFVGSFTFYIVSLLCTLHYPIFLYYLGGLDLNATLVGYLGMLLFGGVCVSLGLFSSSLTQSQLVSGVISFVTMLFLWIASAGMGSDSGVESGNALAEYIAMGSQFENFAKGVLKSDSVVYFASATIFFLFVAQQRIETMRRQ